MDDFITNQTLSDGGDVAPADGSAAELSDVVDVKDLLGKELGKNFPTNEAALKAVKDTFSYVGEYGQVKPYIEKVGGIQNFKTKMEEILSSASVNAPNVATREEIEELRHELWYRDNPKYAGFKEIIENTVKAGGFKHPSEAIEKSEVLRKVLDSASAHNEYESSKTVLVSNPKLGQITDKMTVAKEALNSGNETGARNSAVSAVIDAYEL